MDDGRPAILLQESQAGWRWTKGYVENLVTAVVLAVTDERAAGRIYNVGECETLTWAEWVWAIGSAAGWDGEVVVVPRDHLPKHLLQDDNTDQHLHRSIFLPEQTMSDSPLGAIRPSRSS